MIQGKFILFNINLRVDLEFRYKRSPVGKRNNCGIGMPKSMTFEIYRH